MAEPNSPKLEAPVHPSIPENNHTAKLAPTLCTFATTTPGDELSTWVLGNTLSIVGPTKCQIQSENLHEYHLFEFCYGKRHTCRPTINATPGRGRVEMEYKASLLYDFTVQKTNAFLSRFANYIWFGQTGGKRQ